MPDAAATARRTPPRPDPLAGTFRRMGRVYEVMRRTFGSPVRPLAVGAGYVGMRGVVGAGMALDHALFPALRRARVERPIVIVGNPRTGTTFLHRLLCANGYGAGQEAWRIAFPSLAAQRLVAPALPLIERVSPTRHYARAAHATGPRAVETDDASLLLRYCDGFFLYGFSLAFHDDELRAHFLPEVRDTNARDFAWLEATWRRSLVAHGADTVVAKLFSLGARLPAFQRAFPDARVLYLARDPVRVIPSALSLVTGALDSALGFWSLPASARDRWMARMYEALVDLLRRFHDDWVGGRVDRRGVLIIRYDRMMRDLEAVMDEVHELLGVTPSAAQAAAIAERGAAQRAYRSGHRYDLARFGLSAARIREDTAPFIATFLGGER